MESVTSGSFASSMLSGGNSFLNNVIYGLTAFVIIYLVYRLVYPQKDPRESVVLEFNDAGKAQTLTKDIDGDEFPPLFTGGEMTLSFWLYVSDWDVRAGRVKHVLSVKGTGATYNSIVCALYPLENKMMIRVRTADTNVPSGSPAIQQNSTDTMTTTGSGTNYTDVTAFGNLLQNNEGLKDFMHTVNYPLCDLPEFDLQRWINLTVVVNGRVCDVYLDGKLARSCKMDNVIQFPKVVGSASGTIVEACQAQGFGGALSRVQLYGYAVTPDRVYGMYQAGPTLKSNTLVDRFLALIGANLTFSAYKVQKPQMKCSDTESRDMPKAVANVLDNTGLTSNGTLGGAMVNPMTAFQ